MTVRTGSFQYKAYLVICFKLPCSIAIPDLNENSVDPDQRQLSKASDLGLHCLPMSLLW